MATVDFYEDTQDYEIFCGLDDEESVESIAGLDAKDALVHSMHKKGKIDLKYMSALSGLSVTALIEELDGVAMWRDPAAYRIMGDENCWVPRHQLLKGNLYAKLANALELNKSTNLFPKTIELLKEKLPDRVNPEDIHANLGSTWIPKEIIMDFITNLLEMRFPPRVEYDANLGKWSLYVITDPNYVLNCHTYGTMRMNAIKIIKNMLNARPIKIYDQVPRYDREGVDNILNEKETIAAQEKEKAINVAWQDYIHGNAHVEEVLQEKYMEFYGYVLSRYDGDFLELADLNSAINPYTHQKNAIARIIMNNNSLLAHEVGSGKTLEYMCGIHELFRMGIGHKAIIVVPNSTFEATVRCYKELYEEDKVWAVYPKKEFAPKNREETLKKMASDEYQVIIMAYSSFDMITISKEEAMKKWNTQIRDCSHHLANAKTYATKDQLQKKLRKLKECAKKCEEEYKDNALACFDKLGVDILVVDECQNYKNITLDNKTDNIVGVHNAGSKKADNMLTKVEYIQEQNGRVIFATGTPITNSMADLYVFQRYLQPEELKACNIYHFNEWVNTFCSQSHEFEVDVDSQSYRYTTRFSKFHNLPELMAMFSEVCDFYRISNEELGLPDFDGYEDIVVKKSKAQKEYIDNIASRTEDIRKRRVKRTEDNLLKITVDGRKCALDIRLVERDALVDSTETKVSMCAKQMYKIYQENPGTTQIAFSDISTPKDDFNIYDELKSRLIAMGIPESEIAFIHDAVTESSRNKLEKRFNNGELRVLIGSTMKLGTGCNVQERLLAVHHLDVPWRPSDMVQREGRIIRQGNTNEKVHFFRYVTESSFDSYTWQILENKQRFIAQFLSGSLDALHREESDCADTVLSYSEIKALAIGNPLIKERVELSNELEHARINQRQKNKSLQDLRELLEELPRKIEKRLEFIANCSIDYEVYKIKKSSVTNEERQMIGEELLYALGDNVMAEEDRFFDSYQGFDIVLPKYMKIDKPFILFGRRDSNEYVIKMDSDKALGVCKKLDYALEHLPDTKAKNEDKLNDLYKQQQQAEADIDAGNEYDETVEALAKKLEDIDSKLKESN